MIHILLCVLGTLALLAPEQPMIGYAEFASWVILVIASLQVVLFSLYASLILSHPPRRRIKGYFAWSIFSGLFCGSLLRTEMYEMATIVLIAALLRLQVANILNSPLLTTSEVKSGVDYQKENTNG